MSSAINPKTIELAGKGCQKEAAALGAITPGMLVERAAGGVRAHASAGGVAAPTFANEYGLTGGTINDAYEEGDQVIFTSYAPGAEIYALLATSNNASVGTKLSSAGNGQLRVAAAGHNVVAVALEAVNNTSGSAARLRVETASGYVSA
jgi:hypothetical protein